MTTTQTTAHTATDPRWPGFNTHPTHWATLPKAIRTVLQTEANQAAAGAKAAPKADPTPKAGRKPRTPKPASGGYGPEAWAETQAEYEARCKRTAERQAAEGAQNNANTGSRVKSGFDWATHEARVKEQHETWRKACEADQAAYEAERAAQAAADAAADARCSRDASLAAKARKAATLAVSAYRIGSWAEANTAALRAGELCRKAGCTVDDLARGCPELASNKHLWSYATCAWTTAN